jgi:hypothetical protein
LTASLGFKNVKPRLEVVELLTVPGLDSVYLRSVLLRLIFYDMGSERRFVAIVGLLFDVYNVFLLLSLNEYKR